MSCGSKVPEEYKFCDPFKAEYPNKGGSWKDIKHIKKIQKFHEIYNFYDKHTRQTRYQFSLSNKLIWVSSDSVVPKLHGMKRKTAWGDNKGQIIFLGTVFADKTLLENRRPYWTATSKLHAVSYLAWINQKLPRELWCDGEVSGKIGNIVSR